MVLSEVTVPGLGTVDLFIDEGRFATVGEVSDPGDVEVRLLEGRWVVPAFIDSHVHLAFLPAGQALTEGGVAAAVDLAAPLFHLDSKQPLRVLWSGPMITAVGGYPTRSWGSAGYGLEVSGPQEARAAVRQLHAEGANLIKLPVTGEPQLGDAALSAAVEEAHGLDLKVATHAMNQVLANRAAAAGVDLLAHTPTGQLDSDSRKRWSGRVVISTLSAFGADPVATQNLAGLRQAGATVLYGTDLGNTSTAAIDPAEISALVDAGLDGEAILEAGTSAPAAYWGFSDLGSIEEGKAASFLVLDRDPLEDPLALTEPVEVWMDGLRVK